MACRRRDPHLHRGDLARHLAASERAARYHLRSRRRQTGAGLPFLPNMSGRGRMEASKSMASPAMARHSEALRARRQELVVTIAREKRTTTSVREPDSGLPRALMAPGSALSGPRGRGRRGDLRIAPPQLDAPGRLEADRMMPSKRCEEFVSPKGRKKGEIARRPTKHP